MTDDAIARNWPGAGAIHRAWTGFQEPAVDEDDGLDGNRAGRLTPQNRAQIKSHPGRRSRELLSLQGESNMAKTDTELLKAALIGYQVQSERIEATIADIQGQLGHRGPGRPPKAATNGTEEAAPGKRTMSPSARKKIALAQKKRWGGVPRRKGRTWKTEEGEESEKASDECGGQGQDRGSYKSPLGGLSGIKGKSLERPA
jgi:hypothetical protein